MNTPSQQQQHQHPPDQHGNPQSAAMTITRAPDAALTTSKIMETVFECMDESVKDMIERDLYRVALVIEDCNVVDHALSAIRNCVSTCSVDSLTVLHPTSVAAAEPSSSSSSSPASPTHSPSKKKSDFLGDARAWLKKNGIEPKMTDILQGDEGFEKILKREEVDGVYIFVKAGHQRHYVLAALKARKHVLLKDTVSTPRDEFKEQLDYAKSAGKFIQFSTMFVHHYSSQSFLNCVCARKTFGAIEHIDAILHINLNELRYVNISWPLRLAGQGCIRRLSRYCVLITTLMLRCQRSPVSATVTRSATDEHSGQPIAADCRVEFTGGIVLSCHVAYTNGPTRQVLTVKSDTNRYATMTDFVIPHPDGLSTYRLYDKEIDEVTKTLVILQGESLDVPSGPPQNVTMWRQFHQLCNVIDKEGWRAKEAPTQEAWVLTESALQTKGILMALDESFENGGKVVEIVEPPATEDDCC